MRCPECGFEIDLTTDICPECGEDFTDLSVVQRKIAFNRPPKNNIKHKKATIDSSNVNGYVVYEGQSIKGGKLKRGSSTSKGGTRAVGYDVNTKVRQELIKENRAIVNNDNIDRIYEFKRRAAKERFK